MLATVHRLDLVLSLPTNKSLTMSKTVGRTRNALYQLQFFSRLFTSTIVCHFPHSCRCLSSFWNVVLSAPHVLHDRHTPEPLSMVSMGRLHVDSCTLMYASGMCMRKADSDLNPNHLLVFTVPWARWRVRGHVADLSISPGWWPAHFGGRLRGRCAKDRLEVRERELKLMCHVPVGALKFSHEDHVDIIICATDSGHDG
ncbi:hypothetical protein GQ44DRAFT_382730 [Phaeosphaeriaceae sp. PMI808]|nr:hypothetical protein GQ44DRAFT_382730 [Phaeosphaeriaceae sp. PMI808]